MGVESELEMWLHAIQDHKFSVFFDEGMRLIARKDVGLFLDWAQERSLTLLGAEGFRYDKGTLTPLMDCILDYSTGDPTKSIEMHRKVIEESESWKLPDFVEFTIAN